MPQKEQGFAAIQRAIGRIALLLGLSRNVRMPYLEFGGLTPPSVGEAAGN